MSASISQLVWNPNFINDLKKYILPFMSEHDIRAGLEAMNRAVPTAYEKMHTLVDRIEFIEHLGYVRDEATMQNFCFSGHEIAGVNWDIDALRLYLSLTCVDIFFDKF